MLPNAKLQNLTEDFHEQLISLRRHLCIVQQLQTDVEAGKEMPLPPTTEKTMVTEIDNLLEDKERELLQAIKAENLDRTEFLTKVETVGMMGVLYRL